MRYDRQIILPEIGEEGQKKLQEAKVLIVGVGGLGSPIALYLAGAGVGCLGLVDDDLVSITNLQRQVLYSEKELGKPKAICAAERLSALNSVVQQNNRRFAGNFLHHTALCHFQRKHTASLLPLGAV